MIVHFSIVKVAVICCSLFVNAFECLAQDQPAPALKVSEVEHDFGNIPAGTPVECVFTLTNTGNAPLVIATVHASCGCTKPEFSEEPVLPGKSTGIRVKFNAQGLGTFSKTITVYANTKDKAHLLFIKGNLYAPQN